MPARFLLLFTVTTFIPLLVVVADDFLVDAVDDGVHLENSGEEGGVSLFDFLVVRLDDYLLIQVILDCISEYHQVGINPFQL